MNDLVTPREVIRQRVNAGDADAAINPALLRPKNVGAINPSLLSQAAPEFPNEEVAALDNNQVSSLRVKPTISDVPFSELGKATGVQKNSSSNTGYLKVQPDSISDVPFSEFQSSNIQ